MHFTNYFCYSCYLTHVFNIATSTSFQKAPLGFEPRISCLLDRRFNQLSHGARCRNGVQKIVFPKASLASNICIDSDLFGW